tara:strand:- start:474 stop:899 length:426 start_codon:yes stop_codon:yes gene_type:complete
MAFKLQYKPHIMMTMRADTITRIRVDYTIHLSQSQFFESREGEAGQVQYDTNLNYNTQTADSLYDWACKPLSGSLIPNFITNKLGRTYSSISVTTSSFTDSQYWNDNESLDSMPTMSYTPYTGNYGFSWTIDKNPLIEVEE